MSEIRVHGIMGLNLLIVLGGEKEVIGIEESYGFATLASCPAN